MTRAEDWNPPTEAGEGGARRSMSFVLARILGWLFALPYALLAVLVMTGPPTWSGIACLAGMGLLLVGLITLPGARGRSLLGVRRPRGLARGAVLSILAVALVRGTTARSGETLTFSPEPRLVDRLIDEQDIAVAGTRVLVAGGILRDDAHALPGAMRAAYAAMRAEEGDALPPSHLGDENVWSSRG